MSCSGVKMPEFNEALYYWNTSFISKYSLRFHQHLQMSPSPPHIVKGVTIILYKSSNYHTIFSVIIPFVQLNSQVSFWFLLFQYFRLLVSLSFKQYYEIALVRLSLSKKSQLVHRGQVTCEDGDFIFVIVTIWLVVAISLKWTHLSKHNLMI